MDDYRVYEKIDRLYDAIQYYSMQIELAKKDIEKLIPHIDSRWLEPVTVLQLEPKLYDKMAHLRSVGQVMMCIKEDAWPAGIGKVSAAKIKMAVNIYLKGTKDGQIEKDFEGSRN